MVTKKDFKAVAEIIKQTHGGSSKDPFLSKVAKKIGYIYASNLADYFATQNPRFDRSRFMVACGLD